MKPRHAAALALVGWYLMAPPSPYDGGDERVKTKIPLSEWVIQHVYDSAVDCDLLRVKWRGIAEKADKEDREFMAVRKLNKKTGLWEAPGLKSDPTIDDMTLGQLYTYGNAECIATDDPRLKEK